MKHLESAEAFASGIALFAFGCATGTYLTGSATMQTFGGQHVVVGDRIVDLGALYQPSAIAFVAVFGLFALGAVSLRTYRETRGAGA